MIRPETIKTDAEDYRNAIFERTQQIENRLMHQITKNVKEFNYEREMKAQEKQKLLQK